MLCSRQYSPSRTACCSPVSDRQSEFFSNGLACPCRTRTSVLISPRKKHELSPAVVPVPAWRSIRGELHRAHRLVAACGNSPTPQREKYPGKRPPPHVPE